MEDEIDLLHPCPPNDNFGIDTRYELIWMLSPPRSFNPLVGGCNTKRKEQRFRQSAIGLKANESPFKRLPSFHALIRGNPQRYIDTLLIVVT